MASAHLKQDVENIEQSRAAIVLAEKHQYWQERIEAGKQGGKTLFGWLLEKSQQDLLELLALHGNLDQYRFKESAPSDEVAALMTALNLDMADWWEATVENYLSHVPKDRFLAIVAEAVSLSHAQSMNGLKKVDLARQAEQVLSGLGWVQITSRQLNCRKSSSPDRRGPL